jgi:hypothetical protein
VVPLVSLKVVNFNNSGRNPKKRGETSRAEKRSPESALILEYFDFQKLVKINK